MIIAQSLNRYTCKYVSLYINIKERCFHRSIYFGTAISYGVAVFNAPQ